MAAAKEEEQEDEPKSVQIEQSSDGVIWTISLNRPRKRNAVDGPTAHKLFEAFEKFEKDVHARVAVLCGNEDTNTFCAGADLEEVSKGADSQKRNPMSLTSKIAPMGPSRMSLKKPIIAAISGYAVAGGLELALLCDMRVMASDAILGVFCRRWGVPLIDGGTVRLPRIIGAGRAADLILTGRPVSAQEAVEIGLVNRVTQPGSARAEAERLAREIASFPQACMLSDRQSSIEQWSLPLDMALRNEFALGSQVLGEALLGAARFATEKVGRGGSFDEFKGEGEHGTDKEASEPTSKNKNKVKSKNKNKNESTDKSHSKL